MITDNQELENYLFGIETSLWGAEGNLALFKKYLSNKFLFKNDFDKAYINKTKYLNAVVSAPKWKKVVLDGHEFHLIAPDLVLLSYKAIAEYEVGGMFVVAVSTLYILESERWKILVHHHSFSGASEYVEKLSSYA